MPRFLRAGFCLPDLKDVSTELVRSKGLSLSYLLPKNYLKTIVEELIAENVARPAFFFNNKL